MQAADRYPLQQVLESCRTTGREALARTQHFWLELVTLLDTYSNAVEDTAIAPPTPATSSASALKDFDRNLGKLKATVQAHSDAWRETVAEKKAALEDMAGQVTIALFGRTRAGKSTLMEALTEGDGQAIGTGRQHTTRSVTPYYWPKEGPLLRILDTPGIEGLNGESLAAIAEDYVSRADHIFFLISDDAATPEELERFADIRTLGKSVTVIFNVKFDDHGLLLVNPELVFDPQEIKGHIEWIRQYLGERLEIDPPEVIPVHAQAAWESTRLHDFSDRQRLRAASRLPLVEDRMVRFLRSEALGARIRSPRDLLTGFVYTLKDQFRPYARVFRANQRELERQKNSVARVLRQVNIQGRRRLSELKIPFQKASVEVAHLVDDLIEEGTDGAELRTRWIQLLEDSGVPGALTAFKEDVLNELRSQMDEESFVARQDLELGVGDLHTDGIMDELRDLERRRKWQLAGRVATRSMGQAAVLAGAYALSNVWNPTGWLAGLLALGAVVASAVTDHVLKSATDAWAQASVHKLAESRQSIISALREQLWADYHRLNNQAFSWLTNLTDSALAEATRVLDAVSEANGRLWKLTVDLLTGLDELKLRVDTDLFEQVAAQVVPEVAAGEVRIVRALRADGYTKVIIEAVHGLHGTPTGLMIGRGGERLRRIRDLLGGDHIALVDSGQSAEHQVAQALHPARVHPEGILWAETGEGPVVRVPANEVARAIGREGVNVRMATLLLGYKRIQIEPQDEVTVG